MGLELIISPGAQSFLAYKDMTFWFHHKMRLILCYLLLRLI